MFLKVFPSPLRIYPLLALLPVDGTNFPPFINPFYGLNQSQRFINRPSHSQIIYAVMTDDSGGIDDDLGTEGYSAGSRKDTI